MTFNFHSVWSTVERDAEGIIKPVIEAALAEIEKELTSLGITHVVSTLTQDSGQQTLTPTIVSKLPAAPTGNPVTAAPIHSTLDNLPTASGLPKDGPAA